jgi:hypothetical protein
MAKLSPHESDQRVVSRGLARTLFKSIGHSKLFVTELPFFIIGAFARNLRPSGWAKVSASNFPSDTIIHEHIEHSPECPSPAYRSFHQGNHSAVLEKGISAVGLHTAAGRYRVFSIINQKMLCELGGSHVFTVLSMVGRTVVGYSEIVGG